MFDRILRFSIQHRGLVFLLTLGAAGIGFGALRSLPIDAVPDITNKQVQINTLHPALSPEEIEKQVTFPIEFSLAGIQGLESTRSISRNGFSQVTAVFRDNVDIYFARQQVMERLAEAREVLPEGAEPGMGPVSTGLGEVYMYAVQFEHPAGEGAAREDGRPGWQSDGSYLTPEGERLRGELETLSYLRSVQDWIVGPLLRSVEGVAGVDSIGGHRKQYLVEPDPVKLIAYEVSFQDVTGGLEANNQAVGANYIESRGDQLVVRSDGRVTNVEDIGEIVLGVHNGAPIHVRDVATVGIGRELRTGSASVDGREAVVGTTLMLIGANSRTVAKAVHEKIQEVKKSLPSDVMIRTLLNRSSLVDATIATVRKNLTEGALLVVAILFLFLGNVRASLLTAAAIPLSMLLAAIGMKRLGISGNLMSLGAIDFGVIVDSSIVIVENCLRMLAEEQRSKGRILVLRERLHTVFEASRQMMRPTVFGRAIIITVYLPILALEGVEGKMFHPMALTVICALVGAFILSLTFVPAMTALLVRGRVKEGDNWIVRAAKAAYGPTVLWAVRARWVVVAAGGAALVGAWALFGRMGQVFIPPLDEGNLAVQSIRIPSTGIFQSTELQGLVEKTIKSFPEVAAAFSKTGTAEVATDPMPPNISDGIVILKPHEEWPDGAKSKDDLRERMEGALGGIPGQNYEFSQPVEMRFNELLAGIRGDVAIKIYGQDKKDMLATAQRISALIGTIPGATETKMEQTTGLPFLNVDVRRAEAARYGLNVADVQDILSIAVGGREAGTLYQGDARYEIVVRLPETLRGDPAALGAVPVPLTSPEAEDGSVEVASLDLTGLGQPMPPSVVPLGELARIWESEGPNQISRENGRRRTYVAANVRGRDLGSFVAEIKERIGKEIKLPPGVFLDFGGQYENLAHARERLAMVIPLCFFLIFLLLFAVFNSVKYALLVFSAVPLALTGGVLALWLCGMPFSISAAVGFIAVSGVAVMNGLVLITYINHLRKEGLELEQAICQGALTRLRPVMMTALVDSLGFLPMALAHGRGAEVQKPLAVVVIGGVVTSTLLTLVVVPALYRIWHRRGEPWVDQGDPEHLVHEQPIAE